MDTHEIYANAPLALVVVEARFPGGHTAEGRSLPASTQRLFRDSLGPDWVIEPLKTQKISVSIGPSGPSSGQSQTSVIPRFTLRDRTMAIAIGEGSVTVETAAYSHYPDFRRILRSAFGAAAEVLTPDGVARLGMRYIDEIRVPSLTDRDVTAWREWVHPSLLAPGLGLSQEEVLSPTGWEGAAQYQTGEEDRLVLRYGPRIGHVVDPNGPLRRPRVPKPGPFFLLDFDSFWEPVGIPEFDAEAMTEVCDRLRIPIRRMFDLLVTDRLADEFRKEQPLD